LGLSTTILVHLPVDPFFFRSQVYRLTLELFDFTGIGPIAGISYFYFLCSALRIFSFFAVVLCQLYPDPVASLPSRPNKFRNGWFRPCGLVACTFSQMLAAASPYTRINEGWPRHLSYFSDLSSLGAFFAPPSFCVLKSCTGGLDLMFEAISSFLVVKKFQTLSKCHPAPIFPPIPIRASSTSSPVRSFFSLSL